jgi:hypothetical protein
LEQDVSVAADTITASRAAPKTVGRLFRDGRGGAAGGSGFDIPIPLLGGWEKH